MTRLAGEPGARRRWQCRWPAPSPQSKRDGEGEGRVEPRAILERQPPLQREDEATVGEGERDVGEHV